MNVFQLPKKRWKINLLIFANAISGAIGGILLMAHIHAKNIEQHDSDHARIMQLVDDPKVYWRMKLLAETGKPLDESDELVVKAACNLVLGQLAEFKMGIPRGTNGRSNESEGSWPVLP